jgi:outer membrane lipoprotein-sorting protein
MAAARLSRLKLALSLACISFGLAAPVQALAQSADSRADALAKSIVEKADQIRFPQEDFEVEVAITTRADGQVTDSRKYRVMSKGNENTIALVTEPASDRGQALLMRGRDLWIFLPNVSQPVRLSLSQRLTGQVANGDIARANFSGDYNPRVVRTEKIDGDDYFVLELAAVDRGVTYNKVLYWVKQSNAYPLKAEFYSLSDRLLKTARYEDFKPLAGRARPTRIVMQDALRKGEESVLEYSDMKLRELPDKMFTKDYLKRL